MKILEEGFLKRNRNIILIALGIFLVFFIAGAVYGYISIGDNAGQITEAMINASQSETSNPLAGLDLSSVDLFTHNLGAAYCFRRTRIINSFNSRDHLQCIFYRKHFRRRFYLCCCFCDSPFNN